MIAMHSLLPALEICFAEPGGAQAGLYFDIRIDYILTTDGCEKRASCTRNMLDLAYVHICSLQVEVYWSESTGDEDFSLLLA